MGERGEAGPAAGRPGGAGWGWRSAVGGLAVGAMALAEGCSSADAGWGCGGRSDADGEACDGRSGAGGGLAGGGEEGRKGRREEGRKGPPPKAVLAGRGAGRGWRPDGGGLAAARRRGRGCAAARTRDGAATGAMTRGCGGHDDGGVRRARRRWGARAEGGGGRARRPRAEGGGERRLRAGGLACASRVLREAPSAGRFVIGWVLALRAFVLARGLGSLPASRLARLIVLSLWRAA